MKKKMVALLLTAALALSLTACGNKDAAQTSAPAAEEQTEKTDGEGRTFTVGFDAEFPPYGYLNDAGDDYVGFDLDLAQEVCSRKGWTLKKQPIDWDSKDMELESGAIDCIWNGFTMNGLEDKYTWTVPYCDNSQVFVVPTDGGIAAPADLEGKVLGVQKASSALAALEDPESTALTKSLKELVQYADYNTAFMDLETGAIDALAIDIGVAKYQIKQREEGYQILNDYLSTEQYGIGFKLGNTELKDEVEATLLEMVNDGTFAKIADNYADFGLPDSICLGK